MLKMTAFIAISFLLMGVSKCESAKPIKYHYVLDLDHNICSKREIVSLDPKFDSIWVEDLPASVCNGGLVIIVEDQDAFFNWIEDLIQEAKKTCNQLLVKMGLTNGS